MKKSKDTEKEKVMERETDLARLGREVMSLLANNKGVDSISESDLDDVGRFFGIGIDLLHSKTDDTEYRRKLCNIIGNGVRMFWDQLKSNEVVEGPEDEDVYFYPDALTYSPGNYQQLLDRIKRDTKEAFHVNYKYL